MGERNTKEAVEMRAAVWRRRVQAELERILARLKEHPNVLRVILFGSLARGECRRGSDLDLVIVQRTDKRFLDRLDEFYRLLAPTVETDILVYTPSEWDELRRDRAFVRRIAGEGVVLYESAVS